MPAHDHLEDDAAAAISKPTRDTEAAPLDLCHARTSTRCPLDATTAGRHRQPAEDDEEGSGDDIHFVKMAECDCRGRVQLTDFLPLLAFFCFKHFLVFFSLSPSLVPYE